MDVPMHEALKALGEIDSDISNLQREKRRLQGGIMQEIIALEKFGLLQVNWTALRRSVKGGEWSAP